ncbi:type I-C CRISPR-associated protein Cas7/Csd2 [Actinosynnema sp. NPDC047251]|uniref:Csd2 family CRISPR-associated protein n=1 Tax=Saccharothrix espanaensis (strain ATCC 51144 / DSM 44229 / JCM 9112 / NBRC 15066 / NRRL 15764) TaxID=1179773 RepID=K0JX33_SACES|nr:type I-C CRISPR-associated protein Cas7/Csd2 [Saccharothrix espanaensis]CCH29339.1 Csd2 family CRISPR-associated protein [Saccharothrix espanaensis DSM 44229]
MTEPHLDPTRRHDAVLLFDVLDGNPNGDPDAGNQPRVDVETGQGLVTDVSLKRKIRDQIPLLRPDEARYKIFVEADTALNTNILRGFTATDTPVTKKTTPDQRRTVQDWLCNEFFDIRMFGGVVSTGTGNAGRIRGPLQLTFARSIDRVLVQGHGITRITQTTEKDITEGGESTEMGTKWTVHYGLYRVHLHYSAPRGIDTHVTPEDLDVLWKTLTNLFEHDRASGRGEMDVKGLHVFTHDDAYGKARASQLFSDITVSSLTTTPRNIGDYKIKLADTEHSGVTRTSIVE